MHCPIKRSTSLMSILCCPSCDQASSPPLFTVLPSQASKTHQLSLQTLTWRTKSNFIKAIPVFIPLIPLAHICSGCVLKVFSAVMGETLVKMRKLLISLHIYKCWRYTKRTKQNESITQSQELTTVFVTSPSNI